MTPANRKRLLILRGDIERAVTMNPPAASMLLQILGWQERLINIASDLHMRPEANDQSAKKGSR